MRVSTHLWHMPAHTCLSMTIRVWFRLSIAQLCWQLLFSFSITVHYANCMRPCSSWRILSHACVCARACAACADGEDARAAQRAAVLAGHGMQPHF